MQDEVRQAEDELTVIVAAANLSSLPPGYVVIHVIDENLVE